MSRPLILITNDDGFDAKGISSLVMPEEFNMLLQIDRPQSGMGHAITVNNPLSYKISYLIKLILLLYWNTSRLYKNGNVLIKRQETRFNFLWY